MIPPRARRAFAPLLVLAACACTGFLVGDDLPDTPSAVFDTVWSDMDRYYASFGLRNVDWNASRDLYQPQALAAATADDLYVVIAKMLRDLNDPHVILYLTDGRQIQSGDPGANTPAFNLGAVRTYAPALGLTTHGVIYGRIGPDLGYLRLPSFFVENGDEIDAALAALGSPSGLIIDVRDNLGGYVRNAELAAARFADQSRRYRFVRYRNGPRHDDFTPYQAEYISPGGARQYGGPIIVLTNRRSASATEDFVLALRVRPGTTFLGDTTAGALSIPMLRELPGGAALRVPQAVVYDVQKVTYEGIGIAPTVFVSNQAAGPTQDLQVEAAMTRLRTAALR